MIPAPGYAFIIEDQKDDVSESGLILTHRNQSKGSIGYIHAVNGSVLCPRCAGECTNDSFKKGDHVIYSKFVAEQVDYKEAGMKEGKLFSVPVDAILAKID